MFSYLDEPAYSCGAVYFQGIKGLLYVMKSLPVTGFMSAEINIFLTDHGARTQYLLYIFFFIILPLVVHFCGIRTYSSD